MPSDPINQADINSYRELGWTLGLAYGLRLAARRARVAGSVPVVGPGITCAAAPGLSVSTSGEAVVAGVAQDSGLGGVTRVAGGAPTVTPCSERDAAGALIVTPSAGLGFMLAAAPDLPGSISGEIGLALVVAGAAGLSLSTGGGGGPCPHELQPA